MKGPRPSVEALIIAALERISSTGERADRVSRRTLRSQPELTNEQRRTIAQAIHGVRCFEGRLSFLLRAVELPTDARHRLAAYWTDVDGQPAAEVVARLGVSATIEALDAVPWPDDPVDRLAAERSLPRWLAERWSTRPDADALAPAMNVPGPITVRANTLMNDRGELAERLAAEGVASSPTAAAQQGLHLHGRPDIRGSACFRAGRFEVQDEGSQRIAEALQVEPGETVIDLCAGAGGKTLALAAAMDDRGRLVAADIDSARLGDLQARLRKAPLSSVQIVKLEVDSVPSSETLPVADRVLVDAPCSATGTLRRGPDHRWRMTEAVAAEFPALQLELLQRARCHTRAGGRIVYATCTLLAAENEAVVAAFAQEPEIEPAPVFGDGPATVELTPHVDGTDGFFVAAFRRR